MPQRHAFHASRLDEQPYDEKWVKGSLAEDLDSKFLEHLPALVARCKVAGGGHVGSGPTAGFATHG